jgi:ectoine hydroxylase-related dioxygenase (phytanoyl-CoA dioxygenase family)
MITRQTVGGYFSVRASNAPQAAHQLESDGYAILSKAFASHEITALSTEIDAVYTALPPDDRGTNIEAGLEEHFRYEMFNRSVLAREIMSRREILDVIEPLLGEDCHVIANTCWRNPPQSEYPRSRCEWHIDGGPHIPLTNDQVWPADIPHPVFSIGVHIYLMSCPIECGPTAVIPGTHKSGLAPPKDQLSDENLSWSGENVVPLTAESGDVALFVSDIWHRRLPPHTDDRGRFFLQVHYARRDIAQRIKPTHTVNHLDATTLQSGMSQRQKLLFGLHPMGFYDA